MTTTYLDSSRSLPYCAGCGHPHVLRAVDGALAAVATPARRLVLVTDIGCVGLADAYFPGLNTVHTLHGRSVAIAAGLRLGATPPGEEPLRPVVLIGDGGVGIGLLHLVHAAQLNVDVTVVVHNNLVYGMTGGQHSVLTPPGLKTTTTPDGCPTPPLDLGAIVRGAGGGFFARVLAPSAELQPTLAAAIDHPGFACVEVFELCPTFAAARGGVTGKTVQTLPQELGLALGIVHADASRPVFGAAATAAAGADADEPAIAPNPAWRRLDRVARVVVAGRAGERVQSAALLAASAACAAGLEVAVRTDNPVTQGSGFSLAEITFAPEPVAFTGLSDPDLIIAVAAEGLAELRARGLLAPPGAGRRHVIDADLAAGDGLGGLDRPALRKRFGGKGAALGALMAEISAAGWWAREAWQAAISTLPAGRQGEPRATLDKVDAPAP